MARPDLEFSDGQEELKYGVKVLLDAGLTPEDIEKIRKKNKPGVASVQRSDRNASIYGARIARCKAKQSPDCERSTALQGNYSTRTEITTAIFIQKNCLHQQTCIGHVCLKSKWI